MWCSIITFSWFGTDILALNQSIMSNMVEAPALRKVPLQKSLLNKL
jgi:hypothetical protein